MENNSKADELYPSIWFPFWSHRILREVLPVTREGEKKAIYLLLNQQVSKTSEVLYVMNALDHLLSTLFFCQKAATVSVVHDCQKSEPHLSYRDAKFSVFICHNVHPP